MTVVAESGATLTGIGSVSIGDDGYVTFTGTDSLGSRLFVVTTPGKFRAISSIFGSNRTFSGSASAGGRRVTGTATPQPMPTAVSRELVTGPFYIIRTWGMADGYSSIIASSASNPKDFDSAQSFVDINANGVVAFAGLINGSSSTALFAGDARPPVQLAVYSGSVQLRPQISDTNEVVVRDNLGRIIVWPYPSGSPTIVASTTNGFVLASTGLRPGISSDGKGSAFVGDRGLGVGLYAGLRTGTTWSAVPVSGPETADGLTGFVSDARVGISRREFKIGPDTTEEVTAAFVASSGGVQGLYRRTLRRVNGTLQTTPAAELLVAIGDTLRAGGPTITSINLGGDVINADGVVAAGVSLSNGGTAAIASEIDSDGDGLYDSWETPGKGIPISGGGFYDLAALGATPDRKDLFVEVDAMNDFEPEQQVLDWVRDAFANSPVDDNDGVRLHLVKGGDMNVSAVDWPDPKAGFDAFKLAHFGDPSERNGDPSNPRLTAKKKAFRYCVFAQRYLWTDSHGNPHWDSSGLAELPGDDFMVTLGDMSWPGNRSPAEMKQARAGTLMHELGHTLGIGHGGSGDDFNDKPNYVSVMNYIWQSPYPQKWVQGSFGRQTHKDNWKLGYSTSALPDLLETSLDETKGIGGDPLVYTPIGVKANGYLRFVSMGIPVDWNDDGDTTDAGVMADANRDGVIGASALVGREDWSHLVYRIPRKSTDVGNGIDAGTVSPEPSPAVRDSADMTCRTDFNGDGFVTGDDYDSFVDAFVAGDATADYNEDGFVTGDDFDAYVDLFVAGC